MLDQVQCGTPGREPIVLIHGPPGIGKTTFCANADKPIFLRTEDGLGALQVDTLPEITQFSQLMEALKALFREKHDYQTIVIDSISALERLIHDQVAIDFNKDHIEDIGYGRGYVIALQYWRRVLDALRHFAQQGIRPILIAHSDIVKFESPEVEAYDRYQIKCHKKAFHCFYEQCDIIGFAHYPVFVKKSDADRGKGVQTGDRQLRLVESPAVVAKNRYDCPETLPLDYNEFNRILSQKINNIGVNNA